MTATESAPSYESFIQRGTGLMSWLRALPAGEPSLVPEQFSVSSVRNNLTTYGKSIGCKFSGRVIDGKLWVVRLKPEDAS